MAEGYLNLEDILSDGYDKMRPPKENDEATIVRFHVTVTGLDSINEYSMVSTLPVTILDKLSIQYFLLCLS